MDSGYVRVSGKLEIAVGKMKKVILGGRDVLIANIDGNYYAVGGECTHFGGDLSEGVLEGNVVMCPNHEARFDVTTGKVISPPAEALSRPDIEDLPTYLVKVEHQDIMIKG
ncbi:Rieske 2Fe-2S domain-containing protein [Candidatus Bathyarchaeota archaeon]|nr:Rieske 2Fe-2S domain-containing protein [Candidatus Bathyarchaeota archaeon]